MHILWAHYGIFRVFVFRYSGVDANIYDGYAFAAKVYIVYQASWLSVFHKECPFALNLFCYWS